MEQHTETRTYQGESGTQAFDGYAGFTIGTRYELEVAEEGEGLLRIRPAGATWAGLVLTLAQYRRWFE